MGVEQRKPTETTVNKQQQPHLQVQQAHKPQPVAQVQDTFDFNPRQHEKNAKPYITPFDAHQESDDVDLFGQQPFSSTNGRIRAPSRENSHSPSPPVQTDVFGSVPFTSGVRETPSRKNGPAPSTTSKQLDQFGSEPFGNVHVTSKSSHNKTATSRGHQEPLTASPPTDPFGHTPFVVTENKLFRQSDDSSSSSPGFSPTHQSISASCSEDLLITNRR